MAYIPNEYKVMNIPNNMGDNATWKDLLAIDFAYNHETNNYDDGLSFMDRLHEKLGEFHAEWNENIPLWKNDIRQADNPCEVYVRIIEHMLSDPGDIMYYGV